LDFSAYLKGFSVPICPPMLEMPLLKRLDQAGLVPAPGLDALLRNAYQTIGHKAIEAAYQESGTE